MSSSRSVAAAQRRRAGPTPESSATRGPSTSINSSQVFSQNQPQQQGMRPGTTGRLAGQQAAVSQQQHLQGAKSQSQGQKQGQGTDSASGLNPLKMSIPQAITLVSLRLGKLENQLQNLEGLGLGLNPVASQQYESDVIGAIMQRLDQLEQKTNEIPVLKQQLELLKPNVVSAKNTCNGILKDVTAVKTSIEQMKAEIHATQTVISDLQFYLSSNNEGEQEEQSEEQEPVINDEHVKLEVTQEIESSSIDDSAVANLKDLVEQESTLSTF